MPRKCSYQPTAGNMKKILFMSLGLLILHCLIVAAARAATVPIFEEGPAYIRGLLPDVWQEMSIDERQVYLRENNKMLNSAGKLLRAFSRQGSTPGKDPVLFVFHSDDNQKVTDQQREKIYSWFEKNRAIAWRVAPVEVKNITLDNIEYLHARDTIIFDITVEVREQPMHGVSGIIFLEQGYLNIIGYEPDGKSSYHSDFKSFIKTISISKELKYETTNESSFSFAWVVAHWQQIAGTCLFLLVYGLVFLRKEKPIPFQ